MDSAAPPTFGLKEFLNEGPAKGAEGSLSSSFAELTNFQTLAGLDSGLIDEILAFSGEYPGIQGSLSLREAIGHLLQVCPENIIVTNGADEAIALTYMGLLKKKDIVSIIEPIYGPLKSLAQLNHANIVSVKLTEIDGWHLPKVGWSQLLSQGPRIIALNTPHNPTGWMPSELEIDELVVRADRSGTIVLSDEVYSGLNVDAPGKFNCLAAKYPRAVSIGSLSKAFGLPGLRIGWVVSQNLPIIRRLKTLRMHANTYVSKLSEYVALVAINNASKILSEKVEIVRNGQKQLMCFAARRPELWSLSKPSQGPVAFAKWLGPVTTTTLCSNVLGRLNLLMVPSALFNFGEKHVRFGFGTRSFVQHLSTLEKFIDLEF